MCLSKNLQIIYCNDCFSYWVTCCIIILFIFFFWNRNMMQLLSEGRVGRWLLQQWRWQLSNWNIVVISSIPWPQAINLTKSYLCVLFYFCLLFFVFVVLVFCISAHKTKPKTICSTNTHKRAHQHTNQAQ